jgi:hypothetical protein
MALLAWYPLKEDAKDKVQDNHGATTNISYSSGRIGNAADFNGSSSLITIDDEASLNPVNVSLALWVKFDSINTKRSLISKRSDFYDGNFWLYVDESNNILFDTFTSSGRYRHTFNFNFLTGVWYHVCAIYDGIYSKVYINSELENSVMIDTGDLITTDTSVIRLGCDSRTETYHLDGMMNDVRIYDHALSEEEIKNLYKPLILHYTFNIDSIDDIIYDESGYGNHGNLVSGYEPTHSDSEYSTGIGSYQFGSSSVNYIEMPDDIGYRNEFSAFAWFKSNGTPGSGYHIIYGGEHLEISIPSAGAIRCGIYTNTRQVDNHGSGLTDGNWHHVGMVYDGSTKKAFIDGVEVGSVTTSGTLTNSFSNRRTGTFGSSTQYYTNGWHDDLRIYAAVFTEEEVKALYNRSALFDNNNSYKTNFIIEKKKLVHWLSGEDAPVADVWNDRIGNLDYTLQNYTYDSDNKRVIFDLGSSSYGTASSSNKDFGKFFDVEITFIKNSDLSPQSEYIIDFASVTLVPSGTSGIGLNIMSGVVNTKPNGNTTYSSIPNRTTPVGEKLVYRFGVIPGTTAGTCRSYSQLENGDIEYGSNFSELDWDTFNKPFYLNRGVAPGYYSHATIYDLKIWINGYLDNNNDQELKWKSHPDKTTTITTLREITGTTKMHPDGALDSSGFEEV